MSDSMTLELYAVRNKEGKFFRRKGYGGYGATWVDGLTQARLYTKLGPARSQVSYFANNWPQYGAPDIVMLKVTEMHVLDETERNAKLKEARRIAAEKKAVRKAKEQLSRAEADFERAKAVLTQIKGTL